LGLYSLARRIETLHGKCGVKKRRDEKAGSIFWFSFPYRPDEVAAGAINHPQDSEISSEDLNNYNRQISSFISQQTEGSTNTAKYFTLLATSSISTSDTKNQTDWNIPSAIVRNSFYF
jgi:hypothetical protein